MAGEQRRSAKIWWMLWRDSNTRWWYSTVHISVAIIGAGVIGLPSAMQQLGWWPGMLMLGVSTIITASTLWQMIQLHEQEGRPPVDRFADLGKLLEIRGGRSFMFTLQLIVQISTNIAYMVTGGYALKLLTYPEEKRSLDIWSLDIFWMLVYGAVQGIFSLFATFSTMTIVNLVGTLTAMGYSTIIWASALVLYPAGQPYHPPKDFFSQANALGVIAFSFGGQNILLDIQATMRGTPQTPTKYPMWNGVVVAYLIIAFCYFPVASVGYKVFQHRCFYNIFYILLRESKMQEKMVTHRAVQTALVMLITHLIGGYQIYALPLYELLERRFGGAKITRLSYVGLTCLVAILLPSFNELLGLIGGLALAPSCYLMPCVVWMVVKRPRFLSLAWIANLVAICFGVTLMIVAIIGGFKKIIDIYRLFHFPTRCDDVPLPHELP